MCGHEKNNLHDKRVCGSRTEAFFAISHLQSTLTANNSERC